MATGSVTITRSAVLSTEKVEVRQPVNFVLNTVIGIVFGLMGTIFLVFFMNYIIDRIKTMEDVEKRLGVRVLGAIPKQDNKDSK
ncbi:hypothetical protein J0B03_04290 [Alkalibacter rhizosphaerae]|uniref:Lipopolysaccharide biosynthesis protein n=1 Tax=Alkalibacter rhizosphaerae TaxID=2815577 RepID=A0A974XJ17_9FIRM|nr:hypothetical protein [Alkalibacter rhizosphaerae]QSX09288.1 hypothetical protein J0B03_04290 [Alkalibacter rhizosphaerae]